MLKLNLIGLTLLVLSLASINSHAKNFVIGVEDIEYYPLYAQRDGKYAGFARELFDAYAKKHGHTVTYKEYPIKRLYSVFLSGEVDFKFPDHSYWAGDLKKGKNVVYSEPVVGYIDGVVVAKENKGKGKDALKRLGTVRGFTAWDYMGDIKSGAIKKQENSELGGLFKLIKAKRIDGIYFNIAVARYFLKNTAFEQDLAVFDPDLPHTKSAYHVSTIKHPEIVKEFNGFLKTEAALIESLKQKYELNVD